MSVGRQVRSVRAEIDRREAAGQFVAGRGGAGGANPMRTLEERAKRSSLIVSQSDSAFFYQCQTADGF